MQTLAEENRSVRWDPYLLAGTPRFGNPQAGILYPPNWLFFVIPARLWISWLLVAHHWWAGVGTYLLSRRYHFAWGPSVFAGMCFLGAPFLLAQTGEGHYAQICLVAWTPFAFLGVERCRAGCRGGVALTSGVLALCFFCGHVQELLYLVLILTAFLLPDFANLVWPRHPAAASRPAARRAASLLLMRWVIVGLAVAGLTAIELLPTWIYSRNTIRAAGMDINQLHYGFLGPASLLQLLDPGALGGPTDYRGPGQFYCETLCCLGLPALMLGLAGICGEIRRHPVLRFAVLGLISVLFAFGDQTPVFPLLHRLVPGVSLFRCPSRMLFFSSFFAAILAGAGLDHLQSLMFDARRKWRIGLAAAAALLLGLGGCVLLCRWTMAAAEPAAQTWWATFVYGVAWSRVFSVMTGVLLVIWFLAMPVPRQKTAFVLALSAVVLSAAWYGAEMLRTVPPALAGRDSSVIAFLRGRLGNDRVLAEQELLSDREARQHGLRKLVAYDPVPLMRVALYAVASIPGQDPAKGLCGFEHLRLTSLHKPLVDAAAVRYAVVAGRGPEQHAGWRRVSWGSLPPEFTLRGQASARRLYTIYENPASLPRAFVLGGTRMRQPDSELVRQLRELPPRQAVFLEQDVLPAGARQAFRPASIVEDTAVRVSVRASLDAPGYLVLSDVYYPGWTARVDGLPATVLPANLAFRAVALKPGEHVIEFRFSPPGFSAGAFISAITIIALLIMLVRRPRSSAIPQPPEAAGDAGHV